MNLTYLDRHLIRGMMNQENRIQFYFVLDNLFLIEIANRPYSSKILLVVFRIQELKTETKQVTYIVSEGKADWLKQKEQQAQERKAAAKVNKVEQEIEQTEIKIKELDTMLFEIHADFSKAQELFEQKTQLEEQLEQLYQKWEELQ